MAEVEEGLATEGQQEVFWGVMELCHILIVKINCMRKKKKKNECLEGGWIKNQNTKMNCIFTYQECLENVNIFSRIREE